MPQKYLNIISVVSTYLIITLLSCLILYSLNPAEAINQLIIALIGLVIILFLSRVNYQMYSFSSAIAYFLSFSLLLTTLVFGHTARGSVRWLNFFGLTLQTSEIIKPLLIIFISKYLTENSLNNLKSIAKFLGYNLPLLLLVLIQPDLGTTIILASLILMGLITSGVSFKYIFLLLFIGLLISPISLLILKPYQLDRLTSFISPQKDPLQSGYNVLQATIAIGSGQFMGKGLGQGTQSHLRFLPERQTDFIFATAIEEIGFLGGFLLFILYAFLCFQLIRLSRIALDDQGSLICLLSCSLILIQIIINVGMNMGIMPVTGITLPLFSQGGSSLISFALILAMCCSVALTSHVQRKTLEIK